MDNREELPKFNIKTTEFSHFVGVTFANSAKTFNFGTTNGDLAVGDKVVIETIRGLELGFITKAAVEINNYKSELGLKPIIRKATDVDVRLFESNIKDAKVAMEITRQEIENLKLDMTLTTCEYTLDKAKIIISYVAEERVDFRELLKVLASKLHTRIELRQIGPRDKAKMIGGVGMCGLPLCCSTFLNEFDGISINRAKNQMLAINIPKLSGHCGKLLCCLKFEDDTYTQLKTYYPEVGSRVFIDKVEYAVTSINVISRMVKIDNEEDSKLLTLDEFKEQTHWFPRKNNNRENN